LTNVKLGKREHNKPPQLADRDGPSGTFGVRVAASGRRAT